MPSIVIHDSLNAEIISANPQVNSGFGKYLKGVPAQLLAGVDVAGQFRKDLHLISPGQSGFGLTFSKDIPLGTNGVALTVSAGAKAVVGVYHRGMELFENTFVGAPVKVPTGQSYVAFSFQASLEAGLSGRAGELSFGFDAGTEAEFRCYRPFDVTGAPINFGEACKAVLESFSIPNTVDDLKKMKDAPDGTIACVSGHGQVQVGGSVDFAAALNPLASINTIAKVGKLEIGGGASATAAFRAKVSGDFQMRVQKVAGNKVRLSYHNVAARELDISLEAKAGPALTLGDKDLLKMMFGGQSGLSGTTEEQLVAGGISTAQLDRIKSAMKAGMSKKLELALSAQFSSIKRDDAAFLYEIDLGAIDGKAEAALEKALAGDLTDLNSMEPELPGHGIRLIQSRLENLRKKQVSLRVNLVGLINVVSVTSLIQTGTVFQDEESGELVITDKVTADHLGAVTQSRNLRRLLYESAMMTLTYKASGVDVNTGLKSAQSFFFFDRSANRQRMSDYLDAVAGLDLMEADDIDEALGAFDDFGTSSLLLETSYDQAACDRLFLDNGAPRAQEFYESAGKQAMLALVQKHDPDAYRRIPLEDSDLWKRMKDAGQPNFRFTLPFPITGGAAEAVRVAVVSADYTLIMWWAKAMATAAKELSEMRAFLKGKDAEALDKGQDPQFRKKREDLQKAIVKSVQNNKSSFDDPWGLVALFLASLNTAEVTATVISPKLTLLLPE